MQYHESTTSGAYILKLFECNNFADKNSKNFKLFYTLFRRKKKCARLRPFGFRNHANPNHSNGNNDPNYDLINEADEEESDDDDEACEEVQASTRTLKSYLPMKADESHQDILLLSADESRQRLFRPIAALPPPPPPPPLLMRPVTATSAQTTADLSTARNSCKSKQNNSSMSILQPTSSPVKISNSCSNVSIGNTTLTKNAP